VKDASPFGGKHIRGYIRNNSTRTYGYLQVSFTLFDANGYQVGTALDNTIDLKPGRTWKFDAYVLEDSAIVAEGPDISGW